jgi:hypothetical protein
MNYLKGNVESAHNAKPLLHLPRERLCRNLFGALRHAQGERIILKFIIIPFVARFSNHEWDCDTVSDGGEQRGGSGDGRRAADNPRL